MAEIDGLDIINMDEEDGDSQQESQENRAGDSKDQEIESQDEKNREIEQKKIARRRRRRRSQMLSYVMFLLVIAVIATAVVMVNRYVNGETQQKNESHETLVAHIENIIETEETIVKPDTTETENFVEPEPTLSPQEQLDERIDEAIAAMPLEDKVAGLFIVTPESITGVGTAIQAGDGTKEALEKWAVGGLIYFRKNIQSGEQLTEMLANTTSFSRYPLFLCVDEEGGSVSRVADAGLAENVGSAGEIGATADPSMAYAAGQSVAGYLTEYGFNLDFAPVADIHTAENGVIGDRAYGSDSSIVASMSVSMIQGLEENGISSCMKHFPGIGSCVEDAHDGLAVTDRTAEQFEAEEFAVYRAGIEAGVDFIMVSNVAVPAFTGDNTPCVMAKSVVTDILRDQLDYEGVIITDAMNMKAITEYYEADEAAILALKAGCDMILMPEDFEKAYNGVLEAVQNGTISEERINDSLRRIYRIKYAEELME